MTDFNQQPASQPPAWLAAVASPQGMQCANAFLNLYGAAYRRSPWLTGLATGAVLVVILINAAGPDEPASGDS